MKKLELFLIVFLCIEIAFFAFVFSDSSKVPREYILTGNTGLLFQESPIENKGKSVLFVGDIMLDRGVEYFMEKENNSFYPFEKISNFLDDFDIVFGNLEGPIVENPPEFEDDSLRFAFASTTAEMLAKAGFDVLGLANNHTSNTGQQGLEQTREYLKMQDINFIGEPIGCEQDFSFEKDGILFLAFNTTFPMNCLNNEITEVVKTAGQESHDSFLVVVLHWGAEYKETNSISQQELAHKLIDVGADLIIGSHPHVVQNIELYNNKLIFYSLGNFIFDQMFSEQTQQGLAVGIEIFEHKTIFNLFSIKSELCQPFLMRKWQADVFLEKIAKNSSPELAEEIKTGKIIIQ